MVRHIIVGVVFFVVSLLTLATTYSWAKSEETPFKRCIRNKTALATIYFLMENNSAPAFRFSRTFPVTEADIDELGHANNVQYVRWVQDTAGAHWLTAYPPGEREAYIWVVLEHRIRYHRPSFAGEELRGTTWIGEIRGAQCQRFVRIERVSNGVLLCEAETQWVLLDPRSQRPKRIEEAVVKRLWEPVG